MPVGIDTALKLSADALCKINNIFPALVSIDGVSSALCVIWCSVRRGLDLPTARPGVCREQADRSNSFALTRSQRQEQVREGQKWRDKHS